MSFIKQKKATVGINLGFLKIEGEWALDDDQRNASWEMYVELVTRISVAELRENEGLLREALSSLYSIFGTTRQILIKYGPVVATPIGDETEITFGHLAVGVLNKVLRPLLSKWHVLLLDYENQKSKNKSVVEHERAWPKSKELRSDINDVRLNLIEYANVLGKVAGVSSLI